MKKVILIWFTFASLLMGGANIKLVDEYLKVSGTKEIVLSLPSQIEKGYIQSVDKRSKSAALMGKFDAKQTMKYFRSSLSEKFRDSALREIIDFYKSPLGKKFKESGLEAMRSAHLKKREEFYALLEKNPPSYQKIATMNNFLDTLELTPVGVHLIGEALGVIEAKMAMSDTAEGMMEDISLEIRQRMLENALYAFGDFSQNELSSVTEQYRTNAGRFEQMIVSGIFKKLVMESLAQIVDESRQKVADSREK